MTPSSGYVSAEHFSEKITFASVNKKTKRHCNVNLDGLLIKTVVIKSLNKRSSRVDKKRVSFHGAERCKCVVNPLKRGEGEVYAHARITCVIYEAKQREWGNTTVPIQHHQK